MNEVEKREQSEAPKPELEHQPQAEMPEDLVEPEGKKSKWKTIKGEVEVESKKVEVSYREKVIELPKHRQEETGIKRIRRRELLPPFPEGLYIPPRNEKVLPCYSSERKFDDFYKFITDGDYPMHGALVHTMDYVLSWQKFDKSMKNIEQFKKQGLYLQEIYDETEEKHFAPSGPHLHCNSERTVVDRFSTPVFVFGNKNKVFSEYLSNMIAEFRPNPVKDNREEIIHIIKNVRGLHTTFKPLRWCHAELALVPTKRSLNVLFFETGDEPAQNPSDIEAGKDKKE